MVDDLCPPALIIKAQSPPAEAVANVHLAIMTAL